MSNRLVSEDELRERLSKLGTPVEDIDSLIGSHIDATSCPVIDSASILGLLQKAQHEDVFRVRAFKLTKEQYDALASYFDDADTARSDPEPDGNDLVKRALDEFINLVG